MSRRHGVKVLMRPGICGSFRWMPLAGNAMKAFILLVVGLQSLLIFGASGPWLDGSTDLARVLSVHILLDKLM